MISFLRKIRQRLLKENHFSKYLLYAIGEIILVVIGILIALQINNWNEEKKSKAIGDSNYIQVLADLQTDNKYIDEKIEEFNASASLYREYIKSLVL